MSNEKSKNLYYFGGVPTAPDIRRIRQHYPDADLKPGQLIDYEKLAEIIGVKLGDPRFRTVTTAWRKAVERDSNKIISTDRGIAFRVIDEDEKVAESGRHTKSAAKKLRRGLNVLGTVKIAELSKEARKSFDFNTLRIGKMLSFTRMRSVTQLPTKEDQ